MGGAENQREGSSRNTGEKGAVVIFSRQPNSSTVLENTR